MKKQYIAGMVLAYVFTQSAFAQTAPRGRVDFEGMLTSGTCLVDTGSERQTVTLDTIQASGLPEKGSVAASKPFDIKVVGCGSDTKKVSAHFEMDNMDPATRTLKNLSTGDTAAKQVNIQLINADRTPVQVGSNGAQFEVADDGTATLTYGAQYYATGKASAGKVTSYTLFTLAYN